MRILVTILLLSFAHRSISAQAPESPRQAIVRSDDWRVTLTVFRSPGTGIQLSKGHMAVFVGHYPTVIKRDGKQRDTQFIRMGVAYYVAPDATNSPYASASFAASLTAGWANSALGDVGIRHMFSKRYSGQLGVAVLHASASGQTRVNPTVGLGVRF